MSDKYTPNYPNPDEESDVPNLSGHSARFNVNYEENAQRAVAQSSTWLIAREVNGAGDSREGLEALGFTVLGERDHLFYEVTPPDGWSKNTSGFWTTVLDETGKERISQFYKGAWYDERAFLNFSK